MIGNSGDPGWFYLYRVWSKDQHGYWFRLQANIYFTILIEYDLNHRLKENIKQIIPLLFYDGLFSIFPFFRAPLLHGSPSPLSGR